MEYSPEQSGAISLSAFHVRAPSAESDLARSDIISIFAYIKHSTHADSFYLYLESDFSFTRMTMNLSMSISSIRGKSAKIQVLPEIVVIENNGLKQQTIKKAIEAVTFYQQDIIAAWRDVFSKE